MIRAELKAAAKQQIKGNIGTLFIISLLTGLISATGLGFLVIPAVTVGICSAYLGMINGNKAKVGNMFGKMDTFGKSLWLSILINFFTGLWSCLFVIPGIVKRYSYSMAYYILADNPDFTAREALNTSKRIMKGHKAELFVLHLSFFWWYILAAITCGLAYIYVSPYISATEANFYNRIKGDGDISEQPVAKNSDSEYEEPTSSENKPATKKLGIALPEPIRKSLVSLKRKPSTIPLVMSLVCFLYFSLNLTALSDTTAKIQGSNMGLSQFCIMLFSLLSMVCMLNAFPRRKKPNIPMIVLMFLMFGIMIFCDIHYTGIILAATNRAESPIVIDDNTLYILKAYSLLNTHMVLVIINAALVALLPVYSKLLRKINTSVEVEDNGTMGEIEITE